MRGGKQGFDDGVYCKGIIYVECFNRVLGVKFIVVN